MALKRNDRYPGRFDAPTAGQPQGAFKNRSAPDAKDGSYLEKDWMNDFSAFFSSLLDSASIAPNGNVDAVGASQYFSALQAVIPGLLPSATDSIQGKARFGTSSEQLAGALSTVASNPLGVLSQINKALPKRTFSASDFIRIPDVAGGLIIQWGSAISTAGFSNITFPIAFPTGMLSITGNVNSNNTAWIYGVDFNHTTKTPATVPFACVSSASTYTASIPITWIAIGY